MESNLEFELDHEIVQDQILFFPKFSRELTDAERDALPEVNLSRGSIRMYRLDELHFHNGDGATWSGQDEEHTIEERDAYLQRVASEVAEAWTNFTNRDVNADLSNFMGDDAESVG